ncbi:MAG: uroporphyrinogen-III synthase [Kiritimatiellia bacterium]
MTFRSGDLRFLRIRSLFVKPVVFAGAGSGSADTCTLGAWEALMRCEVCFHDSLVSSDLLNRLPQHVKRVKVGRRCGEAIVSQTEINTLVTAAARRGRRVVRLKGGDPGIFGGLAEEIETLDALHLPYRVIPGVTSLSAATTGTGMLLTRRGVSRGFTVMTPRRQSGGCVAVDANARASLPMVFFMSVSVLSELLRQLKDDGPSSTTPVAVVFDAGSTNETIIRGSLADIEARVAALVHTSETPTPATQHLSPTFRPGLILVGNLVSYGYHPEWGALMGRRVLLPGSEVLQSKASNAVRDFGGIPVVLPLIRMVPNLACVPVLKTLPEFDWLVITSPSAVRMLMSLLREIGLDMRVLPRIMVPGPGTAEAFKRYGIIPDLVPNRDFGADALLEAAKNSVLAGTSLLRLRSNLAGPDLTQALTHAGFRVKDCVLYNNEPLRPQSLPDYDAIFFASSSAVAAFMALRPSQSLTNKLMVVIGRSTLAALRKYGVQTTCIAREATVDSALQALAATMAQNELLKIEGNKNNVQTRAANSCLRPRLAPERQS